MGSIRVVDTLISELPVIRDAGKSDKRRVKVFLERDFYDPHAHTHIRPHVGVFAPKSNDRKKEKKTRFDGSFRSVSKVTLTPIEIESYLLDEIL